MWFLLGEGEDSARPHRCGNSFLSLGGQPGGPGLPGHHGPRAGAESRVLLSDCCAGRPAGGAGRGVGTGHRAGLGRCSGPQRRQGRAPAPVTVAVFCPFTQVGKRRGGNKLALKTGIVAKKQKTEDEVSRLGVGGRPRCLFLPASVPGPGALSLPPQYLALGWVYWVGEEGFQQSSQIT